MKKLYVLLIVVVFLASCAPKPEQIAPYVDQTLAAWPTQTAYPTLTPENTYTPYPTYTPAKTSTAIIKIVTPTFTASPVYTPTITFTPTATIDPLKKVHNPGMYLVGVDIAPGVWRNDGTGDNCYWEITTKTGDIINNHYGLAGGTMYVSATSYQVRVDPECGKWTWLSD